MALSVDKFKFGSKSIADMYFGTTPVKQIYFGTTLVWEKGTIEKILVAGDTVVAAEYTTGDSQVTVSNLSFFVGGSTIHSNLSVRIVDSDGGVVLAVVTTGLATAMELYELTGYKMYAELDTPVTLKANHTYYIQLSPSWSSFYPAYFQNTAGNYKSYSRPDYSINWSTYNLSGNFLGDLSGDEGMATFINADEGEFMYWDQNDGNNFIFTDNKVFVRSSTHLTGDYVGTIGSSQNLDNQRLYDITILDNTDIFYWAGWNIVQSYYQRNNTASGNCIGIMSNIYDGYSATSGENFIYNTTVYEMQKIINYIGKISKQTSVAALTSGECFTYTGSETGWTNGSTYEVTSPLDYVGELTSLSDAFALTLGKTFLWNGTSVGTIYNRTYYTKTADNTLYEFQSSDEMVKTAELFMALSDDGSDDVVINSNIWYGNALKKISRTDGTGTSMITSTTPVDVTTLTSLTDGGIYYLSAGSYNGTYWYSNSILQYDAASDKLTVIIYNYDTFIQYFTISNDDTFTEVTSFIDCVTELTNLTSSYTYSDLISDVGTTITSTIGQTITPDVMCHDTAVSTDRKYYLEINGSEV